MESPSSIKNRLSLRCPAPGGHFPPVLRVPGHTLSLAADIEALEACLALERAQGVLAASDGIHSTLAVPYCDFLMLREASRPEAAQGALLAVCRLMHLDAANPIPNPLASGRFQLSPLLTALRYSREGILEMGAPVFAVGCDQPRSARLLWSGMKQYLGRNGLCFVIGRDALSARLEAPSQWPRLMADHGLHPDLETDPRPGFRAWQSGYAPGPHDAPAGISALDGEALRFWPAGLQEALLRGCRLACEPAFNPALACLEFVWVASHDMLGADAGDWRGSAG